MPPLHRRPAPRAWGSDRFAACATMLGLVLVAVSLTLAPGRAEAGEQGEAITREGIRQHLQQFSPASADAVFSRRTGSAGLKEAVNYVQSTLAAAGYKADEGNTGIFRFPSLNIQQGISGLTLTAPDGTVSLNSVPISVLAPMSVKPTMVPRARPLVGPLVYGGRGSLDELRNRPLSGCIVALEFDSHGDWTTALELGAKGVVFLATEDPSRMDESECAQKLLSQPLDAPRFYLSSESSRQVRTVLQEAQKTCDAAATQLMSQAPAKVTAEQLAQIYMDTARYPQVELFSESAWNFADGESIWAFVPGQVADEGTEEPLVVVWANLDGSGVVLDHAPAARQALGAAMLLEMARFYGPAQKAKGAVQPRGNLLLVFNTDHSLAMNGERQFAELTIFSRQLRNSVSPESPQATLQWIDQVNLVGHLQGLLAEDPDLTLDTDADRRLVLFGAGAGAGAKPLFDPAQAPKGAVNPGDIKFDQFSQIRDTVTKWYAVKRMERLVEAYFPYAAAIENLPGGTTSTPEIDKLFDPDGPLVADPLFRSILPLGMAADKRKNALSMELRARMTAGNSNGDLLIRDMPFAAPEFLKKLSGITESSLQRTLAALNSRQALNNVEEPGREIARSLAEQQLLDVQILQTMINRTRSLDTRLDELHRKAATGNAEEQQEAGAQLERSRTLQRDALMAQARSVLKQRENYLEDQIRRFAANWPLYKIVAGALPGGHKGHEPSLFFSLEPTSGSDVVGILPSGSFLNYPGAPGDVMKNTAKDILPLFAQVEFKLVNPNGDLKNAPDQPQGIYAVTTMNNNAREWNTFMAGSTPLSSEVSLTMHQASLGLVSVFDGAPYTDSPADILFPEADYPSDWAHIDHQITYLNALLPRLFEHSAVFNAQGSFDGRYDRYVQMYGRVLMRGAREVFSNTPVPYAIVETGNGQSATVRGVRCQYLTYSDPFGEYRVKAIRIAQAVPVMSYVVDERTGEITMARNLFKDKDLVNTSVRKESVELNVEMEPMRAVGLISVLDPRFLVKLTTLKVLDGETDSMPQAFCFSPPRYDLSRVVFVSPNKSLKVLYSQGKFGVRMAYLGGGGPLDTDIEGRLDHNKTLREARGRGYPSATTGTLAFPDWHATQSMLFLDDQRMEMLREKSIQNAAIDKLHNTTLDSLHRAQKSYQLGDYSNYVGHVRSALGTESRAYPDVRNTGNDTVIGVVFYLFLLLPFCFFIERLFIASHRIEKQLGYFFAIFVFMFLLLSAAHPAFSLVTAPSMILLSFVMMALSILVVGIVYGKFNTEMKKIQAGVLEVKQEDGTTKTVSRRSQSAEINRSSALMLALTLGISNMKKRRIRTGLTCATVIILTFTTLSFTSVVNSVSNTGIELSFPASYDGIYLHDVKWKQMPGANVEFLEARYLHVNDGMPKDTNGQPIRPTRQNPTTGQSEPNLEWAVDGEPRALVLPRAWLMPIDPRTPYKLDLRREADGKKMLKSISTTVDAGVGLSPHEGEVLTNGHSMLEGMQEQPKTALEADPKAWQLFSDDFANEIIISEDAAKLLGFKDSAEAIGQPLRVMGQVLTIRNVMNSNGQAFDKFKELDNGQLTPAILSKKESLQYTQMSDVDFTLADSASAAKANSQFMNQNQIVLLPFGTALKFGASLRAISIRNIKRTKYLEERALARGDDAKTAAVKSPARLEAEDLLIVLEKNIWVGDKQVATLYSSSAKSSVTGLINIVIPLLISALIILNTMIGAVYERRREIAIFSALGLAPLHIGMLFLAESLVYATLGGMSGYLLGQGVSKLVVMSGVDLGFSLNYSSTITVFVTAIVMACVLLSTLYPAYVAQRIAVPSEDRREISQNISPTAIWLELPFSFPGHIVPGIAMFLHDYFESHTEGSVGKFTAKEVTLETIRTENGPGLCLFFLCWPSPYDLGVSQEIQFYMVPDNVGVFTSEMVMHHISGEKGDWKRVNQPFIEEIRRLMLLWRTFTPEQRAEYALRGLAQWYDSYEGIGWEMPEELKTQRNRELGDLTGEGEDTEEGDFPEVEPAGA
ncbi:MAG TPA: ABC transporter permease [Planctomycetota bacterium]|nr:ABC transporter permease [Planctomycetota bacterium]